MLTQTPRGTKDIFGAQMQVWLEVEGQIRRVCEHFCFGEIRTPIFEHTELFLRSVGENTDIAQKEMYTFLDKGGRSISLRPEMTAGAVRAFVEHKLYNGSLPAKFYYIGPNFRYERPAAGRMRQHHQFGAEIYGSYSAAADAEVIALADTLFKRLGITGFETRVNSLGGPECHARYNDMLKLFLNDRYQDLCPTCKTRLGKNPMRVLDCKEQHCQSLLQGAPVTLDALGDECRKHLNDTMRILEAIGVNAKEDGKIVRGLDYYTRTVFEFIDNATQLTICGGGRYDNLIEGCGGPAMGGVGFGLGLERLIMMLGEPKNVKTPDVYIGGMGNEGFIKAQALANELRREGIAADADIVGRGVKAQMKYADKTGARFLIIIGDNELAAGSVNVKNMLTGEQTEKPFGELAVFLSAFAS